MTSVDEERPVIRVNAVAAVSCWRSCGGGPVVMPVNDVRKSVEFYRRVFGFRPPSMSRGAGFDSSSASVPLASDGHAELLLRPRGAWPAPPQRWTFAVKNLEDVREKVWELGVKVARDSGEPDHIFRRRGGASLYVLDPDGNEIELVETTATVVRDKPKGGLAAVFWARSSKPAATAPAATFFGPGGGSRS